MCRLEVAEWVQSLKSGVCEVTKPCTADEYELMPPTHLADRRCATCVSCCEEDTPCQYKSEENEIANIIVLAMCIGNTARLDMGIVVSNMQHWVLFTLKLAWNQMLAAEAALLTLYKRCILTCEIKPCSHVHFRR